LIRTGPAGCAGVVLGGTLGGAVDGVADGVLDGLVVGLAPGQPLALRGELHDLPGVIGDEIVLLKDSFHSGGFTNLILQGGLERSYVRKTATLNANVVVGVPDRGETAGSRSFVGPVTAAAGRARIATRTTVATAPSAERTTRATPGREPLNTGNASGPGMGCPVVSRGSRPRHARINGTGVPPGVRRRSGWSECQAGDPSERRTSDPVRRRAT